MKSIYEFGGRNLFERRDKHHAKTLQLTIQGISQLNAHSADISPDLSTIIVSSVKVNETPNQYVQDIILNFLQLSSVDENENKKNDTSYDVENVSTTELDSHANMPVVGLDSVSYTHLTLPTISSV